MMGWCTEAAVYFIVLLLFVTTVQRAQLHFCVFLKKSNENR